MKKEQIIERENFYYFGKKCNEKKYDKWLIERLFEMNGLR